MNVYTRSAAPSNRTGEAYLSASEVLAVVGARGSADVVEFINECIDICCRKSETEAQDMVIISGAGMGEPNGGRREGLLQLEAPRERLAEGERAERGKAEAGPEGEHDVRLPLFCGRRTGMIQMDLPIATRCWAYKEMPRIERSRQPYAGASTRWPRGADLPMA